ncbi:MAG TPA: hypothetical protein PKN54_02365 [Candidatus Cloacimonas acidaminovorans]|nr:hypothetical protein [Candidatus Cloacimonas acidaminovorans]
MNPIIALASIDKLLEGLGVSLDIYIILIITISSLILSAKSIKIGLSLTLLLYSLSYIGLRFLVLDTTYALYAIFGALILMTLSIYTTKGSEII